MALDRDTWSTLQSGHFTLQAQNPWSPLDRRLGRPQGQTRNSGGEEKNPAPARSWTYISQPVGTVFS